jgi:glycosyltransferase involved in cell wall biosynthesis
MRVMQIITRVNRGGTARWIEVLTSGLAKNSIGSDLVAGAVQEDEIEDLAFEKFHGIRINGLSRSVSLFSDLKALIEIRREILKHKPDVINTHTSKAGALGRLAAFSLGRGRPAVVHTFHGHLLYGYFSPLKRKLLVLIERFLSHMTDMYISSGSIVRDDLIAAGVGTKSEFIVVKPGIPDLIKASRSEVRTKFEISGSTVVVGWLGRMVEIKRPDRAVEVARLNPGIIFLMAGDGELLQNLRAAAPSNVIFSGWSTPEEIWAASDIALLTSENEAQPISLVEAGHAGLPSVALGVGSVSEVIENSQTGYVAKDVKALSNYISELALDPDKRTRFGQSARLKMLKEFSVEAFISGHITAYKRALEKRSQ